MSIPRNEDVAISELILAEFYGLLRNPAVLKHPIPADEAVEAIQTYRTHPRWRLIGFPTESRPLHDTLWQRARATAFAFRKLYDTRSALTMTAQGVTEFATVNVKDFEGLAFRKVWRGEEAMNPDDITPSKPNYPVKVSALARYTLDTLPNRLGIPTRPPRCKKARSPARRDAEAAGTGGRK